MDDKKDSSSKLRDATLCFLIKKNSGKIDEACLAMKKRGFGEGRWNGVGGKVNSAEGETVEQAMLRETMEEISVQPTEFYKVAELIFQFPANPDWDQLVHAYFATFWEGSPTESEEMRPRWFKVDEVPYDEMWPDDKFWIPKVLEEKLVKARFSFGENDVVLESRVDIVNSI